MCGDGGRGVRVGWIGQVEAEGHVDPAAGLPGAEDDEALGRGEAEQVGDDGKDRGGGADAERSRAVGEVMTDTSVMGRMEDGQVSGGSGPAARSRRVLRSWW